jgi:hypothetical protein
VLVPVDKVNTAAWCGRLETQLPGWHVWRSSGGLTGSGWYAVPAPAGVHHTAALALPGRVGPTRTPAALRTQCRAVERAIPGRRYRHARYHQPHPDTTVVCPDPENCPHPGAMSGDSCECCGTVI